MKKQSEIPRFQYHHCIHTLNFKFMEKNEVWPTLHVSTVIQTSSKTPVLSGSSRKLQIRTPDSFQGMKNDEIEHLHAKTNNLDYMKVESFFKFLIFIL